MTAVIDGKCEDKMSMQLSRFVCGENRLLSAVCWERRWTSPFWFTLRLVVDSFFYKRRKEVGHCKAAYRREQAESAPLPDRLRYAGL